MARRRRGSLVSMSAERAQQALAYLVAEGRIAAREVEKALSRRDQLIREIRQRMAELGVEGARVGGRLAKGAAKSLRTAEKRTRTPRRRAVSAATKAARRAQGQYMAAVRRLSKDVRKRVLEIRKTKGVRAAIAAAKRLAK
jgi:signal transduction histidine kinase